MVTSLIIAALGLVFAAWRVRMYRAPVDAGHAGAVAWRGGRFRNVADTRAGSLRAVMREFWINRGIRRKPRTALPVTPVRADVLSGPASQALRVTWLGHSTTLIEIDGLRLLTDPVLSERASPLPFAGPKRFTPPALTVAQLPRIDAVLLSHDHFDHLDRDTIRALAGKVERFYAPLGVGKRLIAWGLDAARVVELDWWQQASFGPLTLVATPAQHFSGRGLRDGNSTLWASWCVLGAGERLFFSGDTGMHEGFAQIGERHGPFDLTLIECGAYNELWPDVHMQPEQSIAAHQLVRGGTMMPVHWGTFDLAMHRWDEPAERIRALAAEQGVRLVQPRPGETVAPDSVLQSAWWRAFEVDAVLDHPTRIGQEHAA
ncbi:MBL fold metallo-hydrolase [Rhodanobacter sp. OK091]|uniref:MBL fold metallo-hydrolase n=1 Tax=Rhodanobacter sp. OK091 TaxID=1881037 RepID=UPI0009112E38|nr:MBL fold metallo-hydrolase [Rhodanobacter sp. OK091]SHL60659.1 L-ascorbate metabolism protein UlaG, beta-lactamase superfamily [Rhodanobacter sp. OK091]